MISIEDIVGLFSFYEGFIRTCPGCGKKPRFLYSDTCTTESVVVLKCECKVINRTISLIQLSTVALPKLFISGILAEMVNEWNRRV